jgi:hypothetical protein
MKGPPVDIGSANMPSFPSSAAQGDPERKRCFSETDDDEFEKMVRAYKLQYIYFYSPD